MSWRTVVITRQAKLEEKLNYLYVRDAESTTKIHLSEISVLMIESTAVSLTASLLCELSKRKIKVIFCDEKRSPQSELVSYNDGCDTSLKLKKQIAWTEDFKKAVWTEIVREKILMQANLLYEMKKEECDMLYRYIDEICFGDSTNREGHAAKVYFNSLFGKDFTRQNDSPTNAALNYGYSLILSCFNREIVALGYTTKLGLFHDNMFNCFNLSSDLMEPFRPLVDREVCTMFGDAFGKEEKAQLLSVLNQNVQFCGKSQTVANAIRLYCKCVTDALCENDLGKLRFYRNE
ncbi:MAG: type II CRISPR-associated endonuclease Cas1 [Oscillospiraceae bacterium]|nr:type II CRISPR-associated endonuclease Cas1 [Ruminococcus sp.]MDD7337581.1 type II CRISPR-associated endonuclease Cas1 [Ruminococcus sp.]MDY6060752.1 type II CRISPR-associated endonuclease Cas1 [Oscillospiraceae bacterium]